MEWQPQWIESVPEDLELDRSRFETLVPLGDDLIWRAESSLCTIQGDGSNHHLCFDPGCKQCTPAHPAAQSVSDLAEVREAAVKELLQIFERLREVHPDDRPRIADAILDLAYYNNPVSDFFTINNAV